MSTPYPEGSQNPAFFTATPTPSVPSPRPQSTPDFTQPGPSSQPSKPSTAQTAEAARKDKTLAEFLLMLDDYEPLVRAISLRSRPARGRGTGQRRSRPHAQIPNEVTEYYLQRVGFECEDVRL